MRKVILSLIIMTLILWAAGLAQNASDTTKVQRDLYVVATSHLDTQWRWTIKNTIDEYIPATFRDNMRLMDIYPDYKFSFEGAFKYMLFKEYHPEEYARVKSYIDRGQWNLAGSWVDAVDVNMPSFESLVRQTLYGNGFFKKEFGKTSKDILLPDCFGFGYALPSIAAHCGLESFSTQKLTWGCSVPVPFDIGLWQGVDGSSIVAALNPGDYTGKIRNDLTRDSTWTARINAQGESSGLYAGYRYFGTGDTGGAPDSLSVDWLSKSLKGDGPINVKSVGSDDLRSLIEDKVGMPLTPFLSIPDLYFTKSGGKITSSVMPKKSELGHFQRYNGELLMTRHGVGCYTSQAAMKRWNRKNELLADATERACVIANLVAGEPYPRDDLRETWTRFLWHQFHDDLTGTSIPEAYQFSWNDELLCQNRFSRMLTQAVEATAAVMDTRVKGTPIVVFNPLSLDREDLVEATVSFSGELPKFVKVYSFDREVPSQEIRRSGNAITVIFPARVMPIGYAIYDIRSSDKPCDIKTELKATESSLENKRYQLTLNADGEVASIYDKVEKREMLAAPIKLQFLHDKPDRWPAWEIQYEDISAPPMIGVIKETKAEIVESGPVRVSLLVTQKTDNSILRTTISLSAGDFGNQIEFDNDIDWYERETLLKAAFKFNTLNDSVTYDIGLGTISRGINTGKLYEVPGQQWADMTAKDGSYGVAVLNDCKYGWDHPDSATLRLSLIHTPGVFESWNWVGDQKSQDNGHHTFKYAIVGHKGDWRDGAVVWQAARLNQPLMAFSTTPHDGELGKDFSLIKPKLQIKWSSDHFGDKPLSEAMVTSIKFAENNNDLIIRLRELYGSKNTDLYLQFNRPVTSVREVNGAEDDIKSTGILGIDDQEVRASLGSYQPKALAIRLKGMEDPSYSIVPVYQMLTLPYTLDGISLDSDRTDGDFDGQGNTFSGDLLPDTLTWLDVPYAIGPKTTGAANVVACNGQTLSIPTGEFDKLNLLCASVNGPQIGTYTVDGKEQMFPIPDYARFIGQWNSRVISGEIREDIADIAPGYINTTPVAWYGTHRHNAKGENESYHFTYLFLIPIDLSPGAQSVTLPRNENIRVLAATAVKSNRDEVIPCQPLYDRANATVTDIHAARKNFLDKAEATITCPIPGAQIRFTIDGADPTETSLLYTDPITMTKTTTLKSRAFFVDYDDHYVTNVAFHQLFPHEAEKVAKLSPGLSARYFEGEWSKLPDFDTVKAARDFIADTISLSDFARDEDYGLAFRGYISIPQDGLYNFGLSSDDGSRLFIGDSLVVDNDGLHGEGELPGEIALKAGYHPIYIPMFQSKGGEALWLSIEGPGMEKQSVPEAILFHVKK